MMNTMLKFRCKKCKNVCIKEVAAAPTPPVDVQCDNCDAPHHLINKSNCYIQTDVLHSGKHEDCKKCSEDKFLMKNIMGIKLIMSVILISTIATATFYLLDYAMGFPLSVRLNFLVKILFYIPIVSGLSYALVKVILETNDMLQSPRRIDTSDWLFAPIILIILSIVTLLAFVFCYYHMVHLINPPDLIWGKY